MQYETLYDVPVEGFKEAKRRAMGAREGDLEGGLGGAVKRRMSVGGMGRQYMPGFLGGRNQYQPVQTSEGA